MAVKCQKCGKPQPDKRLGFIVTVNSKEKEVVNLWCMPCTRELQKKEKLPLEN